MNGYTVLDWICHDPLSNVVMSDITDCHRHPEVKRKMYSSMAESDEGELAIPLPRQVHVRRSDSRPNGDGGSYIYEFLVFVISNLDGMPEPQTPGQNLPLTQPIASSSEFSPIQVRISYCVKNPVEGFQFVLPNEAYPYVSIFWL